MPKLNWKLLTKKRGSSTQGLPPGKEDLAWVTNTVTLIYGERDAVLVGTVLSAFTLHSAGRDRRVARPVPSQLVGPESLKAIRSILREKS